MKLDVKIDFKKRLIIYGIVAGIFLAVIATFLITGLINKNSEPDPYIDPFEETLPAANPNGDLNAYSWAELQALAQAKLTEEVYRNKYGIEVGQKKDDTYLLVDIGAYEGFVFVYDAKVNVEANETNVNDGGYAASKLATEVEALYTGFNADLQAAVKEVTVKCNDGMKLANSATHDYKCHIFLLSAAEVGFEVSFWEHAGAYEAEGTRLDFFDNTWNSRSNVTSTLTWWLRSADSDNDDCFHVVTAEGAESSSVASYANAVLAAFVIG